MPENPAQAIDDSPGQPRGFFAQHWRWLCLGGLAFGVGSFALDLPVATFLETRRIPGDLQRFVALGETFGYGLTVCVILLMARLLDPARMKAWRWAALATFAAGMSANVVKLGVARVRPHAVAEKMGTDLGSFASAADTFGPFFPPLGASSAWQSFPSGHAATAAGLAIALSWLYPHARWAFFALAALACFQRLASHAHYLSDVCWGAGLGTVVALGVLAGARKRRQHALPLPIAGAIESSRVDASRSLSRFGRRAS